MRIKYTFFILLLTGLFNNAIAGSFEAIPQPKPKPKCANKTERAIVYPGSYPYDVYHYPFFYISAGFSAYHLKNPTVSSAGNLTGLNTPITSINNNGVKHNYSINLGYAFYNPNTSMFGHFNDVMFKLNYFNASETKNSNLGGTLGNIWRIDGSGRVGVILPIQQTSFTAKHKLIDTGLYYRSIPSAVSLDKITLHPRIGVIFTDFNAKYNVLINYTAFPPRNDTEQYKVQTYYYGVAAGEQLAFHVMPQFLLLGDVELQLLYANADLHASQIGDSHQPSSSTINVNSHLNKVTYRAIAYLGAKFYFMPKANSVNLEAKIGIDHWGYNPQVVTPNDANGGKRVHLASTSQNNPFASLDITVPLG